MLAERWGRVWAVARNDLRILRADPAFPQPACDARSVGHLARQRGSGIVQPRQVQKARTREMLGQKFGVGVAICGGQVQRGIEHREIGRIDFTGKPVGRNEHVHRPPG